MNKFFVFLALLAILAPCCFAKNETFGSMKDPRDGQIYKTVKIGGQVWMAENLNYETDPKREYASDLSDLFHNRLGKSLGNSSGFKSVAKPNLNRNRNIYFDVPTSFCYGKRVSSCVEYGRIYSWNVAKEACPTGWHLPSKNEWDSLLASLDGKQKASRMLEFAAYGFDNNGPISFWSSMWNEKSNLGALGVRLFFDRDSVEFSVGEADRKLSVRCVMDSALVPDSLSWGQSPGGLEVAAQGVLERSDRIGAMTDSRDGHTYKTVSIGAQTWMAENLNYKTRKSYCSEDDERNCDKYGRLYIWNKTKDEICPEGWHVPSALDWEIFFSAIGGEKTAGKVLKAKNGWFGNEYGSDLYGFSILPAGLRYDNGKYDDVGRNAFFLVAEHDRNRSSVMFFNYYSDEVRLVYVHKNMGFSVRCIKNFVKDSMTDPRDGRTYKTVKIGSQTWMAENLNYKTERSSCLENTDSNCTKFGRLYTWNDAMGLAGKLENSENCDACKPRSFTYPMQGVCPVGWHLPRKQEWKTLIAVAGGEETAGGMLKARNGWRYCNGFGVVSCKHKDAYDYFGFTALSFGDSLGKCSWKFLSGFFPRTPYANFWSATGNYEDESIYMKIGGFNSRAELLYSRKDTLFSVRCVKDDVKRKSIAVATDTVISSVSTDSVLYVKKIFAQHRTIGSMTDPRDGQVYKTVQIGKQKWMAENLNYKTSYSFCYDENPENCVKYGRLYIWKSAMTACPVGWHLPTKYEWKNLIYWVGKKQMTENLNRHGFSALPAGKALYSGSPGYGYEELELSENMGRRAYFWSASEENFKGSYGSSCIVLYNDNNEWFYDCDSKSWAYSVRCVEDDALRLMKPVASSNVKKGTMKDLRDGQIYKTVTIGRQTWMAENLNYKKENSSCFNDADSICVKYGRLYTWESAMKACPVGWHVPDTTEWKILFASVGGVTSASRVLKSSSGWKTCKDCSWLNGNGTDDFGFAVLPAGSANCRSSYYDGLGKYAQFWTSINAYYTEFVSEYSYAAYMGSCADFCRFSVRCVKDK